jgi:hypothetical protein
MTMSDSLDVLRRANPRVGAGFAASLEAVAAVVRAGVESTREPAPPRQRLLRTDSPRHLVRVSVLGTALAVVAVAATFLTVRSPAGGPGVESAAAAVKRAATVTAATARESGVVDVRITHGDDLWAAKTVRWHGNDIAEERGYPERAGRPGADMLVVDGVLYGQMPDRDGQWVNLGDPSVIDPDSGTTPAEYLATVREDVLGSTLSRITSNMNGLTTTSLADGSTVYRGTVASGLIERETGFKEGQAIRVLPFGYVAHDEAANAEAQLDTTVTVGSGGVIRELNVTWGSGDSTWRYTVTYSGLGSTPALKAPANAISLSELRHLK